MDIRWEPLLLHLLQFAVLVICSTVVYHGLRREKVGDILRVGLARSAFFLVASLLLFGVAGYLFAEWL